MLAGSGSAPHIGVVGSCNVDQIIRCRRLARPGETVLGDDVVRRPGGKGANQALAAVRLGAHVSLMAMVGDDEDGDWLLDSLRELGVDDALVRRSPRPTGTAFITVDDTGQNEIVVSSGANADLQLTDFALGLFDVVLGQLEVEPSVIDEASMRSRKFILNAGPVRAIDPFTLSRCAVVIVNEVEVEALDLTTLAHCVVTLGAKGAVHYAKGQEVARADAPKVEAVDSVGAGDVFCAAYALMWAKGSSPSDALRFAVTAGSLATLGHGAQGALPTEPEVVRWLKRASS